MKADYLHITYASNVLVPQTGIKVGLEPREVEPLYKALGGTALCQSVENRMIQSGKLLTKTRADAEIDVTDGILRTLFSDHTFGNIRIARDNISRAARERFGMALQANSAVQRLLQREANEADLFRLAGENFLVGGSGVTHLSEYLAEWVSLGGKGEAFTIEDLIFSEDMYAYDEVSMARSMRVAGIPLTPVFTKRPVLEKPTLSEVGLWQMTEEKLAWSERILDQLVQLRERYKVPTFQQVFPIYYENREWVNDDSLLVRRATEISSKLTKATLLLISSDRRLGRRMATSTGLPVARVEPMMVLLKNPNIAYNSRTGLTAHQALSTNKKGFNLIVGMPPVHPEIFIDTGSMEAHAQRVARYPSGGTSAELRYRQVVATGFNTETGGRFEVIDEQKFPGEIAVKVWIHTASGQDRTTGVLRDDSDTGEGSWRRSGSVLRRFSRS